MTGEALCHTATALSVASMRHRYAPLLSQSSKGNIESVDVVPNEGTLTLLYFPESIKGNLVSFVVLRNHFAAALTALQMGLQITP